MSGKVFSRQLSGEEQYSRTLFKCYWSFLSLHIHTVIIIIKGQLDLEGLIPVMMSGEEQQYSRTFSTYKTVAVSIGMCEERMAAPYLAQWASVELASLMRRLLDKQMAILRQFDLDNKIRTASLERQKQFSNRINAWFTPF
jgi:hypothetical protein